jgi:hypothetical protein
VAQHERDGLLAGQPGEGGPHTAALVEGDDVVGDVGDDGIAGGGGLPGGAPAAAAQVVQRGVRGGDREPAGGLGGRHAGPAEGEEDLLGDVLGLVARAEHPGGDPDHARVVGAEHRFQIGAHGPGDRRTRHGDVVLPLGTCPPAARGEGDGGHEDGDPAPTVHIECHTCRAPPVRGM